MTKTWCVGGRQYSNTVNANIFEKVSPKTKKLLEIIKGKCTNCGRNNSQISSK